MYLNLKSFFLLSTYLFELFWKSLELTINHLKVEN
jgi:hypothetical protein